MEYTVKHVVMNNRVHIPLPLRRKVLKAWDNRCARCKFPSNLEINHMRPVIYGGMNTFNNLIPLCHECHKYAPEGRAKCLEWVKVGYNPMIETYVSGIKATLQLFADGMSTEELKLIGTEAFFKKHVAPIIKYAIPWTRNYRTEEFLCKKCVEVFDSLGKLLAHYRWAHRPSIEMKVKI
jgi:hypothetical protein